jgi:hypothetical protein
LRPAKQVISGCAGGRESGKSSKKLREKKGVRSRRSLRQISLAKRFAFRPWSEPARTVVTVAAWGTPLHLDNLSRRVISPALNGGGKGWHVGSLEL